MALLFYALAIFTSCTTAGLYWIGVQDSLFWVYPWYDILLHILGGFMIGCWATGSAAGRQLLPRSAFMYVLGIVLVGGLMWEVFEYVTDLTGSEKGYVIDTIADLINDTIGGLVPALLYWLLYRRKQIHV